MFREVNRIQVLELVIINHSRRESMFHTKLFFLPLNSARLVITSNVLAVGRIADVVNVRFAGG